MHDLIGIRDEDLTPAERDARDRWVGTNAEAAAESAFADRLSRQLGAVQVAPGGPSLAAVHARRPPRRRWVWPAGAVVAMAAAAMVAVGVPRADSGRWKGGVGAATVHADAFAEGPDGVRSLGPGAVLAIDERLVLRTRTSAPGTLAVYEGVGEAWVTVEGPVTVAAGERVLGGGRPQSWRPDRPAPDAVYRVVLCADAAAPSPSGDGCAVTERRLSWAP